MKAKNQDAVQDLLLSVGNEVAEEIDGLFKRYGIGFKIFVEDVATEDPYEYEQGVCEVKVYVGEALISLSGIKQGNGLLSESTVHVIVDSFHNGSVQDMSMSNINRIVDFAMEHITLEALVYGL